MEQEWQFVRESVKYVWKTPEECPMPKFNIEKACSIIYGKKFLLVGDILLFQLHELLLDYFKEGSVQCYGEIACKEHLLCKIDNIEQGNGKQKQPPKMKFIRNDLISNRQNLPIDDIKFTDAKNLELPWISYAHKFNVLILNKGHHWQDDETFRNNLIEVMDSVRTKFPNTLIIYKSTTLGHLNCQSAKEPLSSPPNATELESLPYHWGEIHRQNLIAKEIIEAVGGVFIDLENVMITRIDDHIGGQDCLRWCIPGPADIWLDFLFYVMNELK
ncbi:2579_t:CDS:1 [Dentiscutata erythropus]|uniref:2579_t:CDS:1 n=1 Tax=Dentiscutata erythropus TaxID=1348616 RepID=A0A9N9IHJ9_9GLOM|nr:2579_t:CDS:1 [Dentiscutata erythropus]